MILFLKKPYNLEFSTKEYEDEQVKKPTVCVKNGISNTKLIVYEDGSIYLKNGSKFFKLSQCEIKNPTFYCKEEEGSLKVTEKIESKSFIHLNKNFNYF